MLKAALLVLGALTLSALVWHIGIGRIYEAVTQLGPVAMVLVLLPSLLMYAIEAYGWRVTLGAWGDGVPFWRILAIRTAGEVVNMTTPTAYVGGEPLKAYLLNRHGVPLVEGLASVVTAKTTMTVAQILFILAGIGFGWLPDVLIASDLERKKLRRIRWTRPSVHQFRPRLYHRGQPGPAAKRLIEALAGA